MEQLRQVYDTIKDSPMTNIIMALLTFIIGWMAIKLLVKLVRRILDRKVDLDSSLEKFIVNIIRIVALVVLLVACAEQLGLPMTSFVTLLGTVGLAASLALQDSLANLAGGVFILVSKPFVTGDFIEVGAVTGTVAEIGFIHTVLRTVDNRRVFLPNGTLSADRIINYSAEELRQLELLFPVAYDSDLAKARQVIMDSVLADERICREPAPFVRVWQLSGSSVDIMVRAWVPSGVLLDVKCGLLERTKNELDAAGIAIPFNRLDVSLVPAPDGERS